MRIVITGGSGFIGQHLTRDLQEHGHEIIILTRGKSHFFGDVQYIQWLTKNSSPEEEISEADVFINLAGVSINKGRWSNEQQEAIYNSRMNATNELLRIIKSLSKKPSTLINASAIGIYPTSLDEVYKEDSEKVADNILGRTVYAWEKSAQEAEKLNIRVARMRFGIVLGNEGGALPLISMPYRFYIGGRVGSGDQWLSWVHIHDLVRALTFAVENESISGAINVCAPQPVRMSEFGKTIAHVLKRPHWLPVPRIAMKTLLGKKSLLVLEGQYVLPTVLQQAKFTFSYSTLISALQNLLVEKKCR